MSRRWEAPDRTVLMTVLRGERTKDMQGLYEAIADERVGRCRLLLPHDWTDIDWQGNARSGHVALRAVACPTCGWVIEVTDGGTARRYRLDNEARRSWRNRLRH